MKSGAPGSFGAQLKALREAAGFTQEELATIAGLSVHAVSALERGQRRRPHADTVRALSSALDLTETTRDALVGSARAAAPTAAVDELSGAPLPVPLTVLLGRDADVQTLRRWLSERPSRLITLTGTGGSGKTRLALELARAIADEGGTRVVFVPLAAIRNPALVAAEIAEALGLSDATALDLPRRARLACADHPTLLVLDNFEQILDAAPLIADLLASVPSLQVLATSRAPLRIRGEREYAVGPLVLEGDSSADLKSSPAVRLFVERVQGVQPDFRLRSSNTAVVAAICRRLDALPLALELAAPWLKSLTPEDLLRRLTHDVLLPAGGISPRDLPERQQTINATVAWSYQLLAPGEQQVFRRLGALPGGFSIEAAAAVLSDGEQFSSAATRGNDAALAAAAGLIDKSLLLRVETSVPARPRYQMLETVRAYAALELAAAGEREAALEGLARHCLRDAAFAADGLLGHAQTEWLNRVRDDLENYRGALAWLIEQGRAAEGANIAWQLLFFWVIRGHAAEGLRWYEEILQLPSLPASAECRALAGSGAMWFTLGAFEHARPAVIQALARARECGDTEIAAYADLLLGHIEYGIGQLGAAGDHFDSSLRGYRAISIPWGIGNAEMGLAAVALASGDTSEADRLLDEADIVLRHVGPWFSSLAAYLRAILALRRGSPDDAIACVRGSLTRIRELHNNFAFVYALIPLAAAAVLKGDDEWAARILGVRDAVSERTGANAVDESVNDLREAEREVRVRLGADRWNRAYTAGRRMSFDELLKDIDYVSRGLAPV
ncbi:MAG TPA: helix-turn-helix domain-containing protein [Vicinamibacterales bacterium]|nr:helix-turn-helix domain-containing protein [Vicinamibacterales bacterium]